MRDYKLTPAALGTFAQYDDQTASDPSIWNEFAAAAFRVGHSQVQGRLTLVSCFFFCVFPSSICILFLIWVRLYDSNDDEVTDQSFTLSSYFFDASKLPEPGFIDNAIRGLTKEAPLAINPEYTSQLTNFLFKWGRTILAEMRINWLIVFEKKQKRDEPVRNGFGGPQHPARQGARNSGLQHCPRLLRSAESQ